MQGKIKIGDQVLVTAGKDKGKKGKVEVVSPKNSVVLIAGVNLVKKHVKKNTGKVSGILDVPKPMAFGKIALVCPKCSLPTRVAFKVNGKTKERICKKCKQVI